MLVVANITLELDWLAAHVAVKLDHWMAKAANILDGAPAALS